MEKLRTGTGTSEAADAGIAGAAAGAAAMASLGAGPADLVIVYASARYDLPALLAAVRTVTGDAPLVGASAGGQFFDGHLMPPGTGVCVLVLAGGGYRFGVASTTDFDSGEFEAGRELARRAREALPAERPRHSAVLLLADGLRYGNLTDLLGGVHRIGGAQVPVVGGVAASDQWSSTRYVFHDGEALRGAAVAVWIASPRPLRVCSAHGWQPVGLPMMVTRADGNVIQEIAGRRAAEMLRDDSVVAPEQGDAPQRPNRSHAFGLVEPDGSLAIRTAGVDDEGHLRTLAPLPQYAAVQVATCDPDSLLDISERIVSDALADRDDAGVVLMFSCIVRLDVLGDRAAEESKRLQAAAGDVPTFGFYTHGEFARTTSVAGLHNATITAIAL